MGWRTWKILMTSFMSSLRETFERIRVVGFRGNLLEVRQPVLVAFYCKQIASPLPTFMAYPKTCRNDDITIRCLAMTLSL